MYPEDRNYLSYEIFDITSLILVHMYEMCILVIMKLARAVLACQIREVRYQDNTL